MITKSEPNAFVGTDLDKHLRQIGASSLMVIGMMSSMCVDATVRAAVDLGHEVTVVEDACAAPSLTFKGEFIGAPTVHGSFMAALASGYAEVVTTDELPLQ